MNKLITYLTQFGKLNRQQIALIKEKANELELGIGQCFAEAGKIPDQIGFISDGVIRAYYIDKEEEVTRYFIDENHMIILDINKPSYEYLQAITDCKLFVFSKQDWKEISGMIAGWNEIVQKIDKINRMDQQDMIKLMESNDPVVENSIRMMLHQNNINKYHQMFEMVSQTIRKQKESRKEIAKNIR